MECRGVMGTGEHGPCCRNVELTQTKGGGKNGSFFLGRDWGQLLQVSRGAEGSGPGRLCFTHDVPTEPLSTPFPASSWTTRPPSPACPAPASPLRPHPRPVVLLGSFSKFSLQVPIPLGGSDSHPHHQYP